MREYRYVVDRDGRVFHDGSQIVDPATLRFFLRAMTRTDEGHWLVLCQGERNRFDVPDTPFVVQRLDLDLDGGRLARVTLAFAGDVREPLDPRTLETENGHLYCRIRKDAVRARFGRVAMQQIAPFVVEDGGRPALLLDGTAHPIRDAGVPSGAG